MRKGIYEFKEYIYPRGQGMHEEIHKIIPLSRIVEISPLGFSVRKDGYLDTSGEVREYRDRCEGWFFKIITDTGYYFVHSATEKEYKIKLNKLKKLL